MPTIRRLTFFALTLLVGLGTPAASPETNHSVGTEDSISQKRERQHALLLQMGPAALKIDSELAAMNRKDQIKYFYERIEEYAVRNEGFGKLFEEHQLLAKQIETAENLQDITEEVSDHGEAMFTLPDVNRHGRPALPQSIREKYWTWDKIHRYITVRKVAGIFTDRELDLIADRDMIQLNDSPGALGLARQLKERNPNMICIGYRNSIIAYESFDSDLFREHPDWFMKHFRRGTYETHGQDGLKAKRPLYDMSVPEMREWWIQDIDRQISMEELDGVLIDAFAKVLTGWGPKRRSLGWDPQASRDYNQLFQDELLLKNIRVNGDKGLIIANAMRGGYPDSLKSFVDVYLHGSYLEWIEGGQDNYEEGLSNLIDSLIQIGKDPGDKVICFQFHAGYPAPPKVKRDQANFNIPESTIMPKMGEAFNAEDKSHEQILHEMQEAFPYKLAIFLICANKYSYMGYASTVVANDGEGRWAPHYPEHDKKIGKPFGHAIKKGRYYYEREFEHVSVKLNIETREAVLDWK
ncbi:MAG: hypothetical protein ACI8Z5_001763 [Lentimonas sp.]|jgi:hypothetical protein